MSERLPLGGSPLIRRRPMCRNFLADPLPEGLVAELLDRARRAPSAGNTQAVEFWVVSKPERYWSLTLAPERRNKFAWPGLLAAPVLVVVLTEPDRYIRRYAEPDKLRSGLGESVEVGEPDKLRSGLGESLEAWPVPYWWVDAGMAVQDLLLNASARGLGSCFFGAFHHEAALLAGLGIPEGRRVVGTVALGYPADDCTGPSASRPRRPLQEVVRIVE